MWEQGQAQLSRFLIPGSDTNYVNDQSDKLLLRALGMQKFNTYSLGEYRNIESLNYRANNSYHIGAGFHYKWIGANLTVRLPYINNKNYGKTRVFDFQSYIYLNNIALDLYALSYKGYYFRDNHLLNPHPPIPRLIRNDLYVSNYGLNFQYIFNYSHFSYRAAFIQNQRQLISAGSPIIGGGLHYKHANADSAIIPSALSLTDYYSGNNFNKSAVYSLGVNGGYAYTHVFGKYFFITASASVGLGVNYSSLQTETTGAESGSLNLQLHAIMRGAVGYNAERYFIGVQYYNYISRNNMPVPAGWQQLQTGNIRITYARRFQLNEKTKAKLEEIENKILPEF